MTDKIPEFDGNGLLPICDYELTLAELRNSILVQGPRDRLKYPSWDASWRLWLDDNLEMMVRQLWRCNHDSKRTRVSGSFAATRS